MTIASCPCWPSSAGWCGSGSATGKGRCMAGSNARTAGSITRSWPKRPAKHGGQSRSAIINACAIASAKRTAAARPKDCPRSKFPPLMPGWRLGGRRIGRVFPPPFHRKNRLFQRNSPLNPRNSPLIQKRRAQPMKPFRRKQRTRPAEIRRKTPLRDRDREKKKVLLLGSASPRPSRSHAKSVARSSTSWGGRTIPGGPGISAGSDSGWPTAPIPISTSTQP